jgi:hypothetical protein
MSMARLLLARSPGEGLNPASLFFGKAKQSVRLTPDSPPPPPRPLSYIHSSLMTPRYGTGYDPAVQSSRKRDSAGKSRTLLTLWSNALAIVSTTAIFILMAAPANASMPTRTGLAGKNNIGTAAHCAPTRRPASGDTLSFSGTQNLLPSLANTGLSVSAGTRVVTVRSEAAETLFPNKIE